jgi:beta-xylosidase
LIYEGTTGLDTDPDRGKAGAIVKFKSTTAYKTYRILITSTRSQTANAVQYGEVQLFGTTDHARAPLLTPPPPILDGYRADPDIRVFGDTYYIYPTSDKPNWNTTDFSCWSSKDLIHWKNEGIILDVAHNLSWANIKAWAPTAETRNGKYYFYFVANDRIGVATADTPTGPFTDALGHPLIGPHDTPFPTYPIDPDVFIDDGQAWLYYGNNHLAAVKLKPDMISLDGAPVELTPKDKADPFREGIFVIKRKGLYYFMWSVDDARSDNYRVAYGIAHSPLGPIEIPPDNVILCKHGLAKGTGHHAVVNVPGTDRWYIVYHRHAIPNGNGYTREVCLNRMEFTEDGRIKPVDPLALTFPPGSPGEPIVNGKGSAIDPVPPKPAP